MRLALTERQKTGRTLSKRIGKDIIGKANWVEGLFWIIPGKAGLENQKEGATRNFFRNQGFKRERPIPRGLLGINFLLGLGPKTGILERPIWAGLDFLSGKGKLPFLGFLLGWGRNRDWGFYWIILGIIGPGIFGFQWPNFGPTRGGKNWLNYSGIGYRGFTSQLPGGTSIQKPLLIGSQGAKFGRLGRVNFPIFPGKKRGNYFRFFNKRAQFKALNWGKLVFFVGPQKFGLFPGVAER